MVALLYRPQERVFPSISANPYSLSFNSADLTAEQQAACKLLKLIEQKFSGSRLDVLGRFGHLLRQHQQAIASELGSKWQRADFFWREVQVELKKLVVEREVWQDLALTVAGHSDATMMNNPVKLRQRLLHELFIDTHCAFYNGLIQNVTKPSWKERAFVHIDYIQHLLELSVVDGEEVKNLLGEAWQTRINACKEAKKWELAIKHCQQRLKYLPNNVDFQGELAEIHYLKTLSNLIEEKTKLYYTNNAKFLLKGINKLEKCLKSYPYSLKIFELLSYLYRLRAVNLAKKELLAQALVCSEKAITYNPYSEQAVATRNELIEIMDQLQQRMNQLLEQVTNNSQSFSIGSVLVFSLSLLINPLGTLLSSASNNTSQLNEKDQKLLTQAQQGFTPINAYINSEEAKETKNAFWIAKAVHLWYQIGLPEPPKGWQKELPANSTSSWTSKTLLLQDAVKSVLQNPPLTKASLPSLWQWAIHDQPDLAELDTKVICAFLERHLFEEESERVLITPPTGHSELVPILAPISRQPKMSSEPFISWVFSSQDKRIKIQAIAATVLAITTGCIVIRERAIVAKRENAYQTILAAKQLRNDEAVLKASKEFFNNTSLLKKDERTPQILEIYEESLVRWFPQQPEGKFNPENNEYLELYKQLQKTTEAK